MDRLAPVLKRWISFSGLKDLTQKMVELGVAPYREMTVPIRHCGGIEFGAGVGAGREWQPIETCMEQAMR
jgi:hypothetical protein